MKIEKFKKAFDVIQAVYPTLAEDAKVVINPLFKMGGELYLAPYGKLTELCIEQKKGTVQAAIHLHGESAPVTVQVSQYTLHSDNLQIDKVSCDLPWVDSLLSTFLIGQPIHIAESIMPYVRWVLSSPEKEKAVMEGSQPVDEREG